ncbi:nucleoside deaminase [bacterium]|nr:nucleoside deaminase [bacterium]
MNKFMMSAIVEAERSKQDIPVGAVVVCDGKIIASAHNEREKELDISAHAEILAIKRAEKVLNNWRIDGCELYVTLEPCPMCAWAILQSRIKSVYFGSFDKIYGAFGSVVDFRNISNPDLKIYSGIMEQECNNILSKFWEKKRAKKIH